MRNHIVLLSAIVLLAATSLWAAPIGDQPGARNSWVSLQTEDAVGLVNQTIRPVSVSVTADWDQNPALAQPIGASLEISVFEGTELFDRIEIAMPVPTVPGIQPLLSGPGVTPGPGGTVDIQLPPAVAPATDTRVDIVATYQWDFEPGSGSGTVECTDSLALYRSPQADLGGPRLDCEIVEPPGGEFSAAPGARIVVPFLVVNNESSPVLIDASLAAALASVAPTDTAGLGVPCAPESGEFVAGFAQTGREHLPPHQPLTADDLLISTRALLAPEEIGIVNVVAVLPDDAPPGSGLRLHVQLDYEILRDDVLNGNGSLTAQATVFTSDGPPVAGGRRLVEELKAGLASRYELGARVLTFGDGSTQVISSAPPQGVTLDNQFAVLQLLGLGMPGATSESDELTITTPIPDVPVQITFDWGTLRGFGVLTNTLNHVDLLFPEQFEPFELPQVYGGAGTAAAVDVTYDDVLRVISVYNFGAGGRSADLIDSRPFAEYFLFGLDEGNLPPARDTTYAVRVESGAGRVLSVAPPGAFLFAGQPPIDFQVVRDERFGDDASSTVETFGEVAVDLDALTGRLTAQLLGTAPATPGFRKAFSRIQTTDDAGRTASTTVTHVDRARIGKPPALAAIAVVRFALKRTRNERDKGKLIIRLTPTSQDPGPEKRREPLPEACRDVIVDLGGEITRLTLDDKGRARSDDRRRSIKAKVKTAKDGTQSVTVKLVLKKLDLARSLVDDGAIDADVGKPGIELSIPVQVVWCGELFAGSARATYRAREGRNATLKTAR